MEVPLLDLREQFRQYKEEFIEAILHVGENARFILGKEVQELEEKVSQFLGCRYAVGVASGTDALLLSLRALGIKQGDEVITTPYTFFATAGAIVNVGGRPVFVDINPETYNLDPDICEDAVTERTKAIIPVHLFGQSCDMDPIMEIAKQHNLAVMEDACQSIGCSYKGKMVGTIGNAGCFSFFPSKNLGGFGDGGMVTTDDEMLYTRVKMLRVHGAERKYYHKMVGTNSRLDTIQAAVLLIKLKYLKEWIDLRQKHAEVYYEELNNVGDIILPWKAPYSTHVYNQFIIQTVFRDRLMEFLKKKGIGTAIYYPLPLHLQECFRDLGYKEGDFPVAEGAFQGRIISPTLFNSS